MSRGARGTLTTLLVACLLLLSDDGLRGPDRPSSTAEAESSAAETWPDDDPRRAIQTFTQLLDSPDVPPESRKHLLVARAARWLRTGQAAKALADCDAAIELDREHYGAYELRAAAYEMLGNFELAQADHETADRLLEAAGLASDAEPYEWEGGSSTLSGLWDWLPEAHWRVNPAWLLGGVWLAVTALFLAIARAQRVQGGGSLGRWLWVSATAASLAAAPYAVWAFCAGVLGRDRPDHSLAIIATVASAVFASLAIRPPVRLLDRKKQLHVIEDEAFLARIAELAAKMGIRTPRVRLLLSTSEVLEAQAFAGGLPAPSLVVTDGVLHRLTPAERDGIVAHEMAHIANGSLWLFATMGPTACVAAMLAGTFSPVPLLFGMAVFVGLRRLESRFVELDCDRRAAEAIGCREMVSALAKIHAVNPIPKRGWLSALIYATGTHPPRDVRLAALARRAPAGDRPEVAVSLARVRCHHVLSWLAFLVWLAALVSPAMAWWDPAWGVFAAFPLLFVSLLPLILLAIGVRRFTRRGQRRMGGQRPTAGRLSWAATLVLAIVLLVLASSIVTVGPRILPFDEQSTEKILLPLVAVVIALVLVLWPNKARKLQRKMAVALQLHEFEQVVQMQRESPKLFARDPILRHNFAVAAGLSGNRARAIEELEAIRRDKPKFQVASLALASFLLDDGQPGRAIQIARESCSKLKDDPAPQTLAARALRRLGRLDEAQAAVDRAIAIEPEAGDAYAVAAGIALDRGDNDRARELIAKAHELAPGDASVLVTRAEIALAAEPLETARSAVQEALRATAANPFALVHVETMALVTRLAEREAAAAT